MNISEIKQVDGLTVSGIALVVTQLFRLLFGGYLIGLDQFYYNDLDSALSVLLINVIIGIFTVLYILGKKKGVLGLIALSIILLLLQFIYIFMYFSQTVPDPSWHSPAANWGLTLLNTLFPLITLVFALKIYRKS